jgi:hypothetical protein
VAIDAVCEIEIGRPRAEVAAFAADPDNAAPLMARAIRRPNRKDLRALKTILERPSS